MAGPRAWCRQETQLFYLTDAELPAAGTYTRVQVNLVAGSVAGVQSGAISLIGVNQGPPEAVRRRQHDTTGVDLISTSISTLTNNTWVIDMVEDNNVTALTANGSDPCVDTIFGRKRLRW